MLEVVLLVSFQILFVVLVTFILGSFLGSWVASWDGLMEMKGLLVATSLVDDSGLEWLDLVVIKFQLGASLRLISISLIQNLAASIFDGSLSCRSSRFYRNLVLPWCFS